MIPQDQFDRMAALALVAILLLFTFACQAYAAETGYLDSGPPPEQVEGEGSGELLEAAAGTFLGEIILIRQLLELMLYFALPFAVAALLVYKFCMWFYHTFIRTVL